MVNRETYFSVLLGSGLLAVLGWLLWPAPLEVEFAAVAQRPLRVVIEEQGRTRAHDPFLVAAPVTARLLRPVLEAGDRVTAGQVLATLAVAPDDARAIAVAEANVKVAEARRDAAAAGITEAEGALALARREAERRQELAKNRLATPEEVDSFLQAADAAQARLASQRAALVAAEAEVLGARSWLLGSTGSESEALLPVVAPVSGTLYRVYEPNERVVVAGTPLYALSQDDALEVVVDLLTQDAVQVREGQPLRITGWGGSEELQGVVERVEPQAFTKLSALGVEEQRVNVSGRLDTVPVGLGAEYRITAAIVLSERAAVLTVPVSALFRKDGKWQAFAVVSGQAERREVGVGQRNATWAEVLSGLEEGESVVVFPPQSLQDSARVVEADQ